MAQNIYMERKNKSGSYDTILPKTTYDQLEPTPSIAIAEFDITYPAGSVITVYQNADNISTAPDTSGHWIFTPNAFGYWYIAKDGAVVDTINITVVSKHIVNIT